MMNKYYEMLPEMLKIEACKTFILETFAEKNCKGIYTNCMFEMAEKEGIYQKGIYGSAFSQALEEVTNVEARHDDNGEYIFSVFVLK